MKTPLARGPISTAVLAWLAGPSCSDGVEADAEQVLQAVARSDDPLTDDDLQLALACCYELHYEGFEGVDDRWEWDPSLLRVRAAMEEAFEAAVRAVVPSTPRDVAEGKTAIDVELRQLVDSDEGPALSAYLQKKATLDDYRDFVSQRSVYHLREADPHTWAIPRLRGRPKAALVEIQSDEYGGGRPERMHAALFATMMRALALDDTYGSHWDEATAETLAAANFMSLLGLHRRLLPSLLGQLAVLEMTSTGPNRRYALGLRRLGLGDEACRFFEEHVEADAVHEQVASVDLCGSYVAEHPESAAAMLWGAAAYLELDARASSSLLKAWGQAADRPKVA